MPKSAIFRCEDCGLEIPIPVLPIEQWMDQTLKVGMELHRTAAPNCKRIYDDMHRHPGYTVIYTYGS